MPLGHNSGNDAGAVGLVDTDLVSRLRGAANGFFGVHPRGDYGICDEAADTIERLSTERERLREWALDKSTTHHRLAHENEHLRTEHIASSTAYRELASEIDRTLTNGADNER